MFFEIMQITNTNLTLIKLDNKLTAKVNFFIKSNLSEEDTPNYKPFLIPHLRDSKVLTLTSNHYVLKYIKIM